MEPVGRHSKPCFYQTAGSFGQYCLDSQYGRSNLQVRRGHQRAIESQEEDQWQWVLIWKLQAPLKSRINPEEQNVYMTKPSEAIVAMPWIMFSLAWK